LLIGLMRDAGSRGGRREVSGRGGHADEGRGRVRGHVEGVWIDRRIRVAALAESEGVDGGQRNGRVGRSEYHRRLGRRIVDRAPLQTAGRRRGRVGVDARSFGRLEGIHAQSGSVIRRPSKGEGNEVGASTGREDGRGRQRPLPSKSWISSVSSERAYILLGACATVQTSRDRVPLGGGARRPSSKAEVVGEVCI
jgi:hypothetical protein